MIRVEADRSNFATRHDGCAMPAGMAGDEPAGHPLDRLRGGGGADRFCAWAGRSGRRVIFSVMKLDPGRCADALPADARLIALAVRRDLSQGARRRVLWATALDGHGDDAAVRSAVEGLASGGDAEIHLHWLLEEEGSETLLADLGFPRLAATACRGWRRAG